MEIKECADLIPKLYDMYPNVPHSVIDYIVKIGFYILSQFTVQAFTTNIGKKDKGCVIVSSSSRKTLRRKLAFRNNLWYKQKKKAFNNEYYFSIPKGYEDRIQKHGKKWTLTNVYCTKELNTVLFKNTQTVYILELTDVGMDFYIDKLVTDRVKIYMQRDKDNKLVKV